jgi:hypothetical protein
MRIIFTQNQMFHCSSNEKYFSIWDTAMEFFKIFFIVKLLFWAMQRTGGGSLQRRSPKIKPRGGDYALLLRKRLNTMNWKLLANKARAMYYMRCAYFQGRLKVENK